MSIFGLGQQVFFVRPEYPEEIHRATVTILPDARDPAYVVRVENGGRYVAEPNHLATDAAAARAIQQTALLARAEYFERKAAGLREIAA